MYVLKILKVYTFQLSIISDSHRLKAASLPTHTVLIVAVSYTHLTLPTNREV